MKMKTFVMLCAILPFAGACISGYVHVQVVDMDGNPVAGAKSDVLYYRSPSRLLAPPRPFNVVATSDSEGRFRLPVSDDYYIGWIEDPSKAGYRFEQHCNRVAPKHLDPAQYTYAAPFRFFMYKVPEERVRLLRVNPSSDMRRRRIVRPSEHPTRLDVDLFEYSVAAFPGRFKPHIDFSVVVHFDRQAQRWQIAFETANVDTGLLASTNRVYRAPASGYARRVEVPQEMYADKSFTLYLYTRQPRVYAMLVFADDDLEYEAGRWAHLIYQCADIRINPYGGTLMEDYDDRLLIDGTFKGVGLRDDECLLVERRYPPLPDMKARLENRRRWRELEAEEDVYSKEIGVYADRRKLLREKLARQDNAEMKQELVRVQKAIDDLKKKRTGNILMRHQLDGEIVNMFLPEGTPGTNAVKAVSSPRLSR